MDQCPTDQDSILQVETYLAQAAAAREGGDLDEGIRLLELASDICEYPLIMYNLAVLNDLNGDTPISISYYLKYLDSDPLDGDLVKQRLLQISPNITFREPKPAPIEEVAPEAPVAGADTEEGGDTPEEDLAVASAPADGADTGREESLEQDSEAGEPEVETAQLILQDADQTPPPEKDPLFGFHPSLKTWIAAGVGVAALAAGSYFTWKTVDQAGNNQIDDAKSSALLANLSFGAAGVGLVASGAFFGLDWFQSKKAAEPTTPSPEIEDQEADEDLQDDTTPGPGAEAEAEADDTGAEDEIVEEKSADQVTDQDEDQAEALQTDQIQEALEEGDGGQEAREDEPLLDETGEAEEVTEPVDGEETPEEAGDEPVQSDQQAEEEVAPAGDGAEEPEPTEEANPTPDQEPAPQEIEQPTQRDQAQ